MDKANEVCIHSGVLFNHKEERCYVIFKKMNVTGYYHVKQNKLNSVRQIYGFSHMQSLDFFLRTWKKKGNYLVRVREPAMGFAWGEAKG
jgi:hypothetical protein